MEKLDAACNDNIRDVESRNSKVKRLGVTALGIGAAVACPVAAGGLLIGELLIVGGIGSAAGLVTAGGWFKSGLNRIWDDHQKKEKKD